MVKAKSEHFTLLHFYIELFIYFLYFLYIRDILQIYRYLSFQEINSTF